MKVNEISRSATVAWSPLKHQPRLIAAGTVAGTMSQDFDATGSLEIFGVDLTEKNSEMKLLGAIKSNDRFHKLAWTPSKDTETYKYGIIAGGLANGVINLYNPAAIIAGEEESLIATAESHTGPVQALDFNPFQPQLLASGGPGGEVFIWDLSNPSKPSVYTPGTKPSGFKADVTCVAWNKQENAPHILATVGYNGVTIVWDLRAKRPALTFSDPARRVTCRALAWSPNATTRLVTASEDDEQPDIALWDLQNALAPSQSFQGHTKGVLSLSWCQFDSSLLLSSGKDNRTLCWDTNTASILSEVDVSNNWNFDVQWSPCLPGIASTSSLDGKVSVYSLNDFDSSPKSVQTDAFGNVQQPKKKELTRPPAWLRRPAGATFGFGGTLVRYGPKKPNQKPQIQLHKVVTETAVLERADKLENVVQQKQYNEFCEEKINESSDDQEKSIWTFIKFVFEQNDHLQLLSHLGFDMSALDKQVEDFVINLPSPRGKHDDEDEEAEDAEGAEETQAKPTEDAASTGEEEERKDVSGLFGDSTTNAFDNLPQPTIASTPRPPKPLPTLKFISKEEGVEGIIARALLVGNLQAAVECCLRSNRYADALVLAACGGPDLWSYARETYIKSQGSNNPFTTLISKVVKNDLKDLVMRADLDNWKEALAILCTYNKEDRERFSQLTELLGDRLHNEKNDLNAALLCYISAASVDKTINVLLERSNAGNKPSSIESLQDLVEKVVILSKAADRDNVSDVLGSQLTQYAEFLASQGRLNTALHYVECMADEKYSKTKGAILLDRVFNAVHKDAKKASNKPRFPFEYSPLGQAPGAAHPTHAPTTAGVSPSTTANRQPRMGVIPSGNLPPMPVTQPKMPSFVGVNPVAPPNTFTPKQPQVFNPTGPIVPPPGMPNFLERPGVTSPVNPVTPPPPMVGGFKPVAPPTPLLTTPSMPTPYMPPGPGVGQVTSVLPPKPVTASVVAPPPMTAFKPMAPPPMVPGPLAGPPPVAGPGHIAPPPMSNLLPPTIPMGIAPPPMTPMTTATSVTPTLPVVSAEPPPPPPTTAQAPRAKVAHHSEPQVDPATLEGIPTHFESVINKLTPLVTDDPNGLNDIHNRLKELYKKVNSLPAPAAAQLFKLAQALDSSDNATANEAHEDLKKNHFHAIGSSVMIGLKRLFQTAQKFQL